MADRQGLFVRLAAVITIVLAFGTYLYINGGVSFAPESPAVGFVSQIRPITYDYNSQPGFYSAGNGHFYFYARNSISYRSSGGDTVWSDTHDFVNPVGFGSGGYLALGELRGGSVRVYNAGGLVYSLPFEGKPVLSFLVNEAGFCCVRVEDGGGYHMWIYSSEGRQVFERSYATANIYPVAAALTADGAELAMSLLDVNTVDMESHLMFWHVLSPRTLTNVESWGGYSKGGSIIASLKFNGNSELLAASDSGLARYRITDAPSSSEEAGVEFTNEVRWLAYMGGEGAALALGRGITGKEAVPENTVQFYDRSLRLAGSFTAPRPVSYLYGDSHGAVVGAGQTYYGFNARGVRQWQYNSPKDLKQLIYLDSTDTILEAGYTEARVLRRERLPDVPPAAGDPPAGADTDGGGNGPPETEATPAKAETEANTADTGADSPESGTPPAEANGSSPEESSAPPADADTNANTDAAGDTEQQQQQQQQQDEEADAP